jgi:hypothetical protein
MSSYHSKFYFLLCLLLICYSSIHAQQDSIKEQENLYKKNTFHGSVGTLLIGFTANIFYDRILSESEKGSKLSTFVRIGYQENILSFSQGRAFILEGGMLTGRNFGHFESALGVAYLQSENDVILPAFSIGYRGQKPNGNFMFRTGIGFPELLYFGIGLGF